MKILQEEKKIKTDLTVVFLNKLPKVKSDKDLFVTTLLNSGFTGEKGQIVINGSQVIVGTKGVKTKDDWRELGFSITKKLKNLVKTIKIKVPAKSQDFIEGLYLGVYSFDKYKSKQTKSKLKKIILKSNSDISKVINRAKIKTQSQFLTRDWVNTSPEDAHSGTIEKSVIQEFKGIPNVKVTVYGEKDLKKFKMNGHLAVNRASRHEAKTIKIEYTPVKTNNTKHVVLIGKGLTFDSGGLSIKPGNHMVDMKSDKAGAMSVFAIMKGISKLKQGIKVTAYLGIAENMIDGSSYKPDDIITMMNGKTVHIKNTDAEGRIVLADNLCLAEKENKHIDEIYTFATLTGAAVYQFNGEACGMVGFNDKMKSKIQKKGEEEGEIFMNAEFHKYMLKGVDDSLADLSNTGTPNMGCQKAGLFLTNFLTKKTRKKYLHLDIAGPAFIDKPFGTNVEGGTGFSVRTFIEYLK
jgi:leucyl aminopeptidase